MLNALISAPKINTDLLWGLTGLFVFLALIYFGSVFYFRNKISNEARKVKEKKKELSPMISEFLFYDEKGDKIEKINYIGLKIQIRELIKSQFDRKVLTEIIMDLRKDVSGNTRNELFHIYQDLGLHEDAYKKLESWRWEIISKGIFELTQMDVTDSYGLITRFINDKRSTIRKQAEIAAVTLKEEGISYFLDYTKYRISEWQQLKLLDVIRNKEDFIPPPFRLWLTSKNNDVVLFALRLIKYYNQNDANASLVELVKHKNNHIKKEAIYCIKEFHVTQAIPVLKMVFWKCNTDVKMSILDALAQLGSEQDIDFLKKVEVKDGAFTVRSKAVSAMNTICPERILPTEDITANAEWEAMDEPLQNTVAPEIQVEDNQSEFMENQEQAEELKRTEDSAPDASGEHQIDIEVSDNIPPIKKEEHTSEELLELEVAFETFDKYSFQNDLELSPEEIAFLPIIIDEDEQPIDSGKEKSEAKSPEVLNLKEIEVIYEQVAVKEKTRSLNFEFLPLVVDETIAIENNSYLDLAVDFEEVSNIPFPLNEVNTNIETVPEEIPVNTKTEFSEKPETLDVLQIEVVWEQINGEPIALESALDEIDWSIAFEETIAIESEVADKPLAPEKHSSPKSTSKTKKSLGIIPKASFYDDAILETMVLLENISELGDHRELPYLKMLWEREEALPIKERIEVLIERFSKSDKQVNQLEVIEPEAGYSIFIELIEKCDVESKLILIKEIAEVGDEKEIPLLNSLLKDENTIIQKEAKSALSILNKRLVIEASEASLNNEFLDSRDLLIKSLIEDSPDTEDIFDLNFELCQSVAETPKNSRESFRSTLFDHLCSVSTKLYEKFNG